MTAERLLDDYNYYRTFTQHLDQLKRQGKRVRGLKPTEDRLQAFGGVITWCGREGLDARLWLYSLFKARGWLFAPRLDQLVPKTEKTKKKALARYHALGETHAYHEVVHQEIHTKRAAEGREVDVNRDLTNAAESLKRRYLEEGDARRCMDETVTRTFGYHPQSVVCLRCSLQRQCARKLVQLVGYDAIALRRGEMTVDQARAQVWGGRYGRG